MDSIFDLGSRISKSISELFRFDKQISSEAACNDLPPQKSSLTRN
jgi:hypothetical protein